MPNWIKRPEVVILLLSACMTAFIAAICGTIGWLLGYGFFIIFLAAVLAQVIIFFVINTVSTHTDAEKMHQRYIQEMEALSKFTIKLSCAYCKQPTDAVVILNQRNTFECAYCKQVSSVQMAFTTAQVTTPIESVKIPVVDGDGQSFAEFKISR